MIGFALSQSRDRRVVMGTRPFKSHLVPWSPPLLPARIARCGALPAIVFFPNRQPTLSLDAGTALRAPDAVARATPLWSPSAGGWGYW
jgi:hypothetical protein